MTNWYRSEPRTARPFYALGSIEDALENTKFVLGERGTETHNDTIQLEPAEFEGLHVVVHPRLELEKILAVLGEHASNTSLVLALRDPMFKRRVVHEKWSLDGELPERIPLCPAKVEEFGHKRELWITLALVFGGGTNPDPGWPKQRGTWISRRVFKLKLTSHKSIFDIRKMTKHQALTWTGFEGALIHVEYNDGRLTIEPDNEIPIATCYVAEDIFEEMQRGSKESPLQALVETEIIAAILAHANEDIVHADSVSGGTPLETILKKLGDDEGPMKLGTLQDLVTDPVKLRAAVHDRTDFVTRLRTP